MQRLLRRSRGESGWFEIVELRVRSSIVILLKNPLAEALFYVDRCGATNDFSLWLGFTVMGIESPALRRAHPLHFHLEG